MGLTAGTRLGRYEIRSQLGVGGMGEVYLAHDLELTHSEFIDYFEVARDGKSFIVSRTTGTNDIILIKGFQ